MDLMKAVLGRRSVRKFKPDPVREEDLNSILEAARWAPSWANTQCAEYIVVRDAATKEALAQAMPERNPARRAITQAPVLIAAIGRTGVSGCKGDQMVTALGDWYMFDVALGLANLTLAAHSLGYGTVHVGLLDHIRAGEVLAVPDGYRVVELIPLGVPDHEPQAPPRRPLSEIVHHEKF